MVISINAKSLYNAIEKYNLCFKNTLGTKIQNHVIFKSAGGGLLAFFFGGC